MTMNATVESLDREMRVELTDRILPFWGRQAIDTVNGGFHGRMEADGTPDPDSPRGGILNVRILWAFSAAHRALGDDETRALADRARNEVVGRFLDPAHGGLYWMVDPRGRTLDDRKHVYAQAFAIYALAEHHRATGEESSLRRAGDIFRLLEEHAHDPEHGGYREAFARDWSPLADVRLSGRDLDAPKSENTHLHLLEALTTLYRVWPDALVAERLRELVELFLGSIVDGSTGHTRPFFDADWSVRSSVVSFGHDIETSWLLEDAADRLGDAGLTARAGEVALLLADTVLREGFDGESGGVFYEVDADGTVDRAKEWWTQAEAIVGFLHAYQETARQEFLTAAWGVWAFVEAHMLDRAHGEWLRRVDRDGTPQPQHEKVGPWKGPYHNTRACLQVMERAGQLLAAGRPRVRR